MLATTAAQSILRVRIISNLLAIQASAISGIFLIAAG
jgi:hypothetical protein